LDRANSSSADAGGFVARLEMMAASVVAAAGLPDSAERVIAGVRERNPDDPELLHLEAHARLVLGQSDSAAALLARYAKSDPLRRMGVVQSRRFESLRGHADIVALLEQ
jgi:hypothetical protein